MVRGLTATCADQLTSPPCSEEIFTLRLPVWPKSATANSPRPLCVVVLQPTGRPSRCSSKDELGRMLLGDSAVAAAAAGLYFDNRALMKPASLRAAAVVAASGIQRSSALRGSCNIAKTPAAALALGGISDTASRAARRTCASGSSSSLLLRSASSDASLRGSTIAAARRTPADGCFSAAMTAATAAGSKSRLARAVVVFSALGLAGVSFPLSLALSLGER